VKKLIVMIGDNYYTDNLMENSLSITEQLNERSTCSFQLKTDFYCLCEKGMTVSLYELDEETEEMTVYFNGVVNDVKYKDYYNQNVRLQSINCSDMHYFVDKRIWTRGFVNETCGNIVRQMISEVLEEESITVGVIEDGYNVTAISFSYKKCSEIMNQLAEIAGFVWYVDYLGQLHFINPTQAEQLDELIVTDADVILNSLTVTNKNNQYRNKQYIKGANAVTNTINQTFKGDGSTQSFTLGYRLADKPKIYVNGAYIAEDDIVLKGYNESAKWYYEKNDAVILQNPSHTPLTASSTLRVEYQGIYPIVAITDSRAEINRLYQLGAGTGLIEECDTETEINDLAAAISTATGRLSKYCGNSYQVTFTTRSNRFKTGDKVAFEVDELKDTDYIIDKIDITDDVTTIWYKITAVKGPLCDSWTRSFGKGLQHKPTMALQDVSETETVVLNYSFSKTWILSDNPNIYKTLFPMDGATLADGRTPMFNPDDRVTFIEVIDTNGKVLVRNIKSVQTDPTRDAIHTYFYIDPYDAVGEWAKVRFYGGRNATFGIGTGVLIDENELAISKTQIEGVQISRTDTKGW
jgi:hypothetical protein